MSDLRETILARLAEIQATLTDVLDTRRNDLGLDEQKLPACVLLDADEIVDPQEQKGTGRPGTPIVVTLMPEFLLFVAEKPEDVGPKLSDLLIELSGLVLLDAHLVGWARNATGRVPIRYAGAETDLGAGRTMTGMLRVKFAIDFIRHPKALNA